MSAAQTNLSGAVPHGVLPYAEDAALVRACLDNDELAWSRFLAEYRPMCHIIARKYQRSDMFDDLFSDFVVKLIGDLDGAPGVLERFDGRASLKTFLSVVFHRMVLDSHRAARRQLHLVDADRPVEDYGDVLADQAAEATAAHTELLGDLDHAVSHLPTEDKRMLDLYYAHSFTLKRIATVFRCSEATMSRRLKAITARLKDMLLR